MTSTNSRAYIANIIAKAVEKLAVDLSVDQILSIFERPKMSEHGDVTFPCFQLAKQLRNAPAKIATMLSTDIGANLANDKIIADVSAVGPYLNFRIKIPFLANEVVCNILNGIALANRENQLERVMVEYSQPNTHKAFHVGHVRCAALGDTLVRLFKWRGFDVIPVNYIGDEGTHVARCIWYLKDVYKEQVPNTHLGEFLGEMYVRATEALDVSNLSKVPVIGITVAKVLKKWVHSERPDWFVFELETIAGIKVVVTAAKGGSVGDMVAYARPGIKVAGRVVGNIDKQGIVSDGMLCSAEELSVGDNDNICVLPPDSILGNDLVDVYALEYGSRPSDIIRERENAVSRVLQEIEAQSGEYYKTWLTTKEWSMDEFKINYAWLDCSFDHYFYESECGELGKELAREFLAKGIFEESDGAIGVNLRDEDLGFCILIKRDGTATYACRDLALARVKFDRFKVDRSLYVVDANQKMHFQQVFATLKRMGFSQAEKCFHFDYALVVGKEGKMSSRKGNVVLFSQLQHLLKERIGREFIDQYRGEWSAQEIDKALHVLSLATVRYGMLKQDPATQIIFDLDEWSSRSGNTGPYLLYAYARTVSIGARVGSIGQRSAEQVEKEDFDLMKGFNHLHHESERALILGLADFGDVVEKSGVHYAPHLLAGYLFDLARLFNGFYRDCSILNAESETLKGERFALVRAVGMVLKKGLELLGIPVLNRM
jgi:arginyl-tRNA synthetase